MRWRSVMMNVGTSAAAAQGPGPCRGGGCAECVRVHLYTMRKQSG